MGKLERYLLQQASVTPLSCLRFIDDIRMKWVNNRSRLDNFIEPANAFHTAFKIKAEIDTSNNVFLDTASKIDDGNVEFILHTKPTDSYLYLMPPSCHPAHTFKGVPKGWASRIRRICSTPMFYQEQSLQLKTYLCKCGYEGPKVQAAINEVSNKG